MENKMNQLTPKEALENLAIIAEPNHEHTNKSGMAAIQSLLVLADLVKDITPAKPDDKVKKESDKQVEKENYG